MVKRKVKHTARRVEEWLNKGNKVEKLRTLRSLLPHPDSVEERLQSAALWGKTGISKIHRRKKQADKSEVTLYEDSVTLGDHTIRLCRDTPITVRWAADMLAHARRAEAGTCYVWRRGERLVDWTAYDYNQTH